MNWNYDIKEAPRGVTSYHKISNGKGRGDRTIELFVPDRVLLAVTNKDGSRQILASSWIKPDKRCKEGRWGGCIINQTIDAWLDWPEHPLGSLKEESTE